MKRKVNDDQLRQIVIARIAKGWAFTKDGEKIHARITAEISELTRSEIFTKYEYATYDLRQ